MRREFHKRTTVNHLSPPAPSCIPRQVSQSRAGECVQGVPSAQVTGRAPLGYSSSFANAPGNGQPRPCTTPRPWCPLRKCTASPQGKRSTLQRELACTRMYSRASPTNLSALPAWASLPEDCYPHFSLRNQGGDVTSLNSRPYREFPTQLTPRNRYS